MDPNPEVSGMFKLARPKDVFVNVGVGGVLGGRSTPSGTSGPQHDIPAESFAVQAGRRNDVMSYFMFDEGATNTFSEDRAEENQKAGRKLIGTKKVKILSLKKILDKYLEKGKKIDLLSVDVEGMDLEVLKSNDWKKYRPKVIICEDLEFDLGKFGGRKNGEVVGYLGELEYKLMAVTPYSLIFKEK